MPNVVTTCLCLLALWGCAHGLGALVRRLGRPAPDLPTAVWTLLGLGGVSMAALAACTMGFAPVPAPPTLEALPPQPVLCGVFALAGAVGAAHGLRHWQRPTLTLPACLGGITWAALGMWLLLPPYLIDEALYHLTFPLQYLRHGGWTVIPGHGNSSFPSFGEMLGFWPLACGNVSAARGAQWLAFGLLARALPDLLPQVPRRWVQWGTLIMLWTPVVLCILPSSHVDVLQAVYTLLGVLLLVRYGDTGDVKILWAGAWAVGCSAACKFLALALLPWAGLMVLLIFRTWQMHHKPLPRLSHLAVAGVLALLPVAPYLLRNLLVWHNPVFPFALEWFPASDNALSEAQRTTLAYFMEQFGPADGNVQLQGWAAWVRLPWDLFFAARWNRLQFDGVIGPLAYAVLAAVLAGRGRRPVLPAAVGGMGLYFLLVWLSTSWQMRFIITPYWAVALWAPVAVGRLPTLWARGIGLAAVLASLAVTLPSVADKLPAWDARMWGSAADMHALRLQRIPGSGLCDAAVAQQRSDRTLLVWAQRLALWCDVDLHSDSYDEAASFNAWLDSDNPLQALHHHGIGLVLINEDDFLGMPPGGVGEEENTRLQRIFARYHQMLQNNTLHELARDGAYRLLSVQS